MGDTATATRLGRIEEAISNLKEERIEFRGEMRDANEKIINRLDGLAQNVQSTGAAIAALSLEKCGERLAEHDKLIAEHNERIKELENKTQNLPVIETEIMFWRRVLGGGFRALWKVVALLIGSGFIGAAINKYWH